jgi:hypothetical protein
VLPPSRGRRKAGALAPSVNTELRTAGGFFADRSPAFGFAAVAFDPAVVLRADALGPDDFNGFDGSSCDVLGVACLFVFLLDVLAVARRVFEGAVFADVID